MRQRYQIINKESKEKPSEFVIQTLGVNPKQKIAQIFEKCKNQFRNRFHGRKNGKKGRKREEDRPHPCPVFYLFKKGVGKLS